MTPNLTPRWLIVFSTIAMLTACSPSNADLHQWVAREKAHKHAPLPPLPVVRTFETFTYRDRDKRDPFGPSSKMAWRSAEAEPRPDQSRPRQPLEAFALNSLRMVGTIGAGRHLLALIQAPTGVIYRIHKGNYIGENHGRVIEVGADHVSLLELIADGSGGWTQRAARVVLGERKIDQ